MAAAGLALGLASISCNGLPSTASAAGGGSTAALPVVRASFQVQVRATGELEAENASPIAVPQVPTGSLKVKEVVAEGSIVEAGDTILVFDQTELGIEMDNNVATFRSAERRIDRTRIQWVIESGSIEVMKDVAALERDYATEFQLEDDGIYSQLEILEASLGKELAEEKIVFADAKLLLRGEYFDIDERILGVEKGQTQGKIDRVKTSLGSLILQAPIGGMVVYRKNWRGATVSVGDALWPGNIVMSIVDPKRTSLKVNILEKDAAGIEAGALAEVRIDAHAERLFAGKVTTVSKLSRPIEQNSPVKYFEAKVELDEGDPDILKPGMKGEARIILADLTDALLVPRSAVMGNEGDYHVVVEGPEGPERRTVLLGAGDLVRVSIEEGLQGSERILVGSGTPAAAAASEATTPESAARRRGRPSAAAGAAGS